MTAMATPLTGALSSKISWESINWRAIEAQVYRLQVRIAKAYREGKQGKVKALQWILTHSFQAKLLAVKRVVQNKGGKTPGVDRIIWKTSNQKIRAALSLQKRGYKTQPLRRIYIPKKNGKLRPLSIPAMKCRAMQALYLLSLEPIAECRADRNSYGFRPKRSTADAISQCFTALSQKSGASWILEADIKSCFDKISHTWLRENIPTDKDILYKWLTAGYIDKNSFHRTEEGVPQGGLCSPVYLTMTLSGLEEKVKSLVSKYRDKVNVCIYADDFIITGATKEVLEETVKPAIASFLKERGLELSQEKTKVTHIEEGFDFLGFNIRKYKGKLLIKPSRKNVKSFLECIRETVKSNRTAKTENLIGLLNPQIWGWANYFRHVCAKETYNHVDSQIFRIIWQWIKQRHPQKNGQWRKGKYFRSQRNRNWVFFAMIQSKDGKRAPLDLFQASSIAIKRHIKIRADATPFDPEFREYFQLRERRKKEPSKPQETKPAEPILDNR
jgi:RNA-directed DNA polymerase